jgi:hypothetical protein
MEPNSYNESPSKYDFGKQIGLIAMIFIPCVLKDIQYIALVED